MLEDFPYEVQLGFVDIGIVLGLDRIRIFWERVPHD